jgi:hypothetical protein
MGGKLINRVDVYAHEVFEFLGKRNELLFFLVMKKMQPVVDAGASPTHQASQCGVKDSWTSTSIDFESFLKLLHKRKCDNLMKHTCKL